MSISKEKPYRVSYYSVAEIENGRAPVHTVVTLAANPESAKATVREVDPKFTVLNCYVSYRAYKTPKRKTWYIVSGPESPATKDVLKELSGFVAHDKHEQIMDTFKVREGEPNTLRILPKDSEPLVYQQEVTTSGSSNVEYTFPGTLSPSPERLNDVANYGHDPVPVPPSKSAYYQLPPYAVCRDCGMSDVYYKWFKVWCPVTEKQRDIEQRLHDVCETPQSDEEFVKQQATAELGVLGALAHCPGCGNQDPVAMNISEGALDCFVCEQSYNIYDGAVIPRKTTITNGEFPPEAPASASTPHYYELNWPLIAVGAGVLLFWGAVFYYAGAHWFRH